MSTFKILPARPDGHIVVVKSSVLYRATFNEIDSSVAEETCLATIIPNMVSNNEEHR